MKIEVIIPAETEASMARLRDDAGMYRALIPVMDQQNELTVGHIQGARMSQRGPETLGVRTGRLRRSVRPSKARVVAGGVVSSIGSNVKYMGVHEFGFDGEVEVRPHARKRFVVREFFAAEAKDASLSQFLKALKKGKDRGAFLPGGSSNVVSRRIVRKRVRGQDVEVRGHKRRMVMKERAPIRRGIEDRAAEYGEALTGAIVDFYTGK